MPATLIFLHLAGFVALLLWGMHMVHTGIVRAFGGKLRKMLVGLNNRCRAFLTGMGVTALLSATTAVDEIRQPRRSRSEVRTSARRCTTRT